MQREVNRSKEMDELDELDPLADWALGSECRVCLLSSLLAPGWFTTSCSQIPGALEVFHWAAGQDFCTGRRKLAQIWTSHIVAAGNEGSSRNTPAAWLLVAGWGVEEPAAGAVRRPGTG
jgi:hypothetical protein